MAEWCAAVMDWLMAWLCPMAVPATDEVPGSADNAADSILWLDPFAQHWQPRKRVTFHPLVIVRPFRRDSCKPMRPTPLRVNGMRRSVTRHQ